MISKSNVKFTDSEVSDNAFVVIFFKTMYDKTIIRFVFLISGIIKVSVSVISLSLPLRLITLTSTLIIPESQKPHPIIVFAG